MNYQTRLEGQKVSKMEQVIKNLVYDQSTLQLDAF